jgi:hypothetical protein
MWCRSPLCGVAPLGKRFLYDSSTPFFECKLGIPFAWKAQNSQLLSQHNNRLKH